jgi:hypothetical protein
MKLLTAMAISAGLFAGPMLADHHEKSSRQRDAGEHKAVSTPRQGLEEARTLTRQTLSQAIEFERQKVQRAEREANLPRTRRSAGGEVAADYVGPSARSTGSADRMVGEDNQVPAPGAKEYRDSRQDKPKQ